MSNIKEAISFTRELVDHIKLRSEAGVAPDELTKDGICAANLIKTQATYLQERSRVLVNDALTLEAEVRARTI